MKDFKELRESLKKSIATNSGKFPEGSKVRMKHNGKVGTVLTVGKDFVKVGVGNKQMDHKPSELELVEARKDAAADLYFDTYAAAVQAARAAAEKKGYTVSDDSWFTQVNTGKGKPSKGNTTRHSLELEKGGKKSRQALHIQVYNRGTDKNTYELNFYIS